MSNDQSNVIDISKRIIIMNKCPLRVTLCLFLIAFVRLCHGVRRNSLYKLVQYPEYFFCSGSNDRTNGEEHGDDPRCMPTKNENN